MVPHSRLDQVLLSPTVIPLFTDYFLARGKEPGSQRAIKNPGDPYPRRIDSSVTKQHRKGSYRGVEGHMVGPYPERIVPASPERTMLEREYAVAIAPVFFIDVFK